MVGRRTTVGNGVVHDNILPATLGPTQVTNIATVNMVFRSTRLGSRDGDRFNGKVAYASDTWTER